ncbi:MAG: DUF951 domain-containing protein [Chloroflexota bacterium]|nr:DUF951 domain-containing protein [Chloroflexota bacterium]
MALELKIGDALQMKKPHPCGGLLWTVSRLGADIGINCQGCGRYVLLARSQLARKVRRVFPREQPIPGND